MSEYIVIEKVTLCYPHLWEKHAPPGTDNFKYSAEFIMDPYDSVHQHNFKVIQDAFVKVATEAGQTSRLQYLQSPLKSGDEENQRRQAKGRSPRPELTGKWFIRASDPDYPPEVVAQDPRVRITEAQKDSVFGGCIVNAQLDLYWSGNVQNPGVYVSPKKIQLVDNVNVQRIAGIGGGGGDAVDVFQKIEGAPAPVQPVPTNVGPTPVPPSAPAMPEKMPWE